MAAFAVITLADSLMKGTIMLPKRYKISGAAKELNVCARSLHNYISRYEASTTKAGVNDLPSSPSIGLRPIILHKSKAGRTTRRIDSRDLAEYLENAGREALKLPLQNWRKN